MARNILNSNNLAVLIQQGNNLGSNYSQDLDCNLFEAVQDFNYSVEFPRQDLKQIGSQGLATRDFPFQPDVQLSLTYIPTVGFQNEEFANFLFPVTARDKFYNFFSGTLDFDCNFVVIAEPNQGSDVFNRLAFDESRFNLNGLNAISFGNCFPTTYGLSYANGSMPAISTNYICSNVVMETLTGTSMIKPAINLTGGNTDNVGQILFQIDPKTTSDIDPTIVDPVGSQTSVTLQNLQVGGQNLSGVHFIQSLDMSVDLPRTSLYGLGNDFAYGRKAQLPANGSLTVSSLVSGLDDGVITGVLSNDENYNFDIKFGSASGSFESIYRIEDAKLNSYNYGIAVNDFMNFDAQFTFKVTETRGLKVSGSNT
jgi:hypothetical protein|tara:strand:- start:1060 stop:2163 length:1104 start_codon:yes stop_codon:yes gene_type:complete